MCSRTMWSVAGQPVLIGRNMDWTGKMGTKLHVMPRGIAREGLVDENPLKWTSKYGSVVATIWDASTTDGMNEAGLNANVLYLAETNVWRTGSVAPGNGRRPLDPVLPRRLRDRGRGGESRRDIPGAAL